MFIQDIIRSGKRKNQKEHRFFKKLMINNKCSFVKRITQLPNYSNYNIAYTLLKTIQCVSSLKNEFVCIFLACLFYVTCQTEFDVTEKSYISLLK